MVYRARVLRGLAVTQMIFGSLMIVAGITSIFAAINHWSTKAGFGIWVGIWVSKNINFLGFNFIKSNILLPHMQAYPCITFFIKFMRQFYDEICNS